MWLCSQPATTTAKTTASSLSSSNITTITSSLKTAAIKSRWFPVFSFVCIEWRATSNDARQRRLPNICHFYFSFISASSFFKCWPIRPLYVYFRPYDITSSNINGKSVYGVLGIRTRVVLTEPLSYGGRFIFVPSIGGRWAGIRSHDLPNLKIGNDPLFALNR